MSDVVDGFDGYESYLFKGGSYAYNTNLGEFVSSSFVSEMDTEAREYDRNNRDNLVNNTPEYIVLDDDNNDYLIFLSMIGHYFDNLYLYIRNMPVERSAINQISGSMSVNMLKEMLTSFGWNVDDILSDKSLETAYLSSTEGGYNVLSDTDRMRQVWNRLLVTLPQLYKSKGTEECVRLLLACHGIPSSYITVKEYGGIDYSTGAKVSYTQNEKVYLYQYQPGNYNSTQLSWPDEVKTLEFKLAIPDK